MRTYILRTSLFEKENEHVFALPNMDDLLEARNYANFFSGRINFVDSNLITPKIAHSNDSHLSLSRIFDTFFKKGKIDKAKKLISQFDLYYEHIKDVCLNYSVCTTKELTGECVRLINYYYMLFQGYQNCLIYKQDLKKIKKKIAKVYTRAFLEHQKTLESILEIQKTNTEKNLFIQRASLDCRGLEDEPLYQRICSLHDKNFLKNHQADAELVSSAVYFSTTLKTPATILSADFSIYSLLKKISKKIRDGCLKGIADANVNAVWEYYTLIDKDNIELRIYDYKL